MTFLMDRQSKSEIVRRTKYLASLAEEVTDLAMERKIIPDIPLAREMFLESVAEAARRIARGQGRDEAEVLKLFADALRQASKDQITATFKSLEETRKGDSHD